MKKVVEHHNMRHTQLYRVWAGIKDRTTEGHKQNTNNYKKLGIKMCDEWRNSFIEFRDWALSNGYKYEKLPNGRNKYTIDRIDTYGDYCPNNCRWITNEEQLNNTTTNKYILYNGKVQTLSQWCKELCLNYNLVNMRLHSGWSVDRAFNESNDKKKYYLYNGELLSKRDIAKMTGLTMTNIENRLHRGWDIKRIIEQPKRTKRG